ISKVIIHPAQVIYSVCIRNVGMPRLPFRHLLRTAMMEANIRDRVHDIFSIELKDNAKHTMRARVLRTDVEKHKIRVLALGLHAPLLGMKLEGGLFTVLSFIK